MPILKLLKNGIGWFCYRRFFLITKGTRDKRQQITHLLLTDVNFQAGVHGRYTQGLSLLGLLVIPHLWCFGITLIMLPWALPKAKDGTPLVRIVE